MIRLDGVVGSAPAHRAGDPGANTGPGKNFSLKLTARDLAAVGLEPLIFINILHNAGKRPLGRPRCRWEDNIRMDLKEIRVNARNWVD